jgi:hypothetical protein
MMVIRDRYDARKLACFCGIAHSKEPGCSHKRGAPLATRHKRGHARLATRYGRNPGLLMERSPHCAPLHAGYRPTTASCTFRIFWAYVAQITPRALILALSSRSSNEQAPGRRPIDRASGVVFIALGIKLATEKAG